MKAEKIKDKKPHKFWKIFPLILTTIAFVVVFSVFIVPKCRDFTSRLTDYQTMSDELSKSFSVNNLLEEDEFLKNEDFLSFKQKVGEFATNKDGRNLFLANGGFNLTAAVFEDLTFQGSLNLSKKEVMCFLNSALKTGWIESFFDKTHQKSFLNVVGIKTLSTKENGKTEFCFVTEFMMKSFFEFNDKEVELENVLKTFPEKIYFTFSGIFDNENIYTSSLNVNDLSKKSNKLFLELFFEIFEKEDSDVDKSTSNLISKFRLQLKKLENEFRLSHLFYGQYLLFEQRTI